MVGVNGGDQVFLSALSQNFSTNTESTKGVINRNGSVTKGEWIVNILNGMAGERTTQLTNGRC